MKTLHTINRNILTNNYNDDIELLKDLNINNYTLKSQDDIEVLFSIIEKMNDIHLNINKYEYWMPSEFDDFYGWDIITSDDKNYVRNLIIEAINNFNTLYIKVIHNKCINVYSEDTIDRTKLIVSYSLISD